MKTYIALLTLSNTINDKPASIIMSELLQNSPGIYQYKKNRNNISV